MKIKAVVLDFDETLVSRDVMMDLVRLANMEEEAEKQAEKFEAGKTSGVEALINQINMLSGLDVREIQKTILKDLALNQGSLELIGYCKKNRILTLLSSGNIQQVLDVYKEKLGLDFAVGSAPKINGGRIVGISEGDYPADSASFKVLGVSSFLKENEVALSEVLAIGDGRGDIPMFQSAGYSLAVNPKGGLEEYADGVINNLSEAISFMEQLEK